MNLSNLSLRSFLILCLFGEDGILRYTVVIQSNQGARTVLYEGLRCWGQDAKRYAELIERDGQWFIHPDPEWRPIKVSGRNNYRFSLYNRYWCHAPIPVYSVEDMIKSLKEGGHESKLIPLTGPMIRTFLRTVQED